MKKIISQISLILLIMTIGFSSLLITDVYAANATISVSSSSIKKGDTFTVTVNIPSNAVAYEGKIKIYYKDSGTTDYSSKLTKITGIEGDFAHPGNMSATFTAKATGEAIISVEECVIGDRESNSLQNPSSISIIISDNTPAPTTPETPSTPTTPTTPTEPSGGNSNNGGTTTQGPKFTDVNETVYTTTRCNLRESYSTSSNKVATVNEGTKLTRKGVGDNGWSKLEYNGKTVYASSQYLTTTAPTTNNEENPEEEPEVTFKDTHENLYANQDCNLRASWSTDSEKVGYLKKGQAVERTGYASNGWSRILYNGKTVYVASRLLSVEKPEEDEVENTVTNSTTNTTTNTLKNEAPVNNLITNETTDTPKTEEEILNEIKEEVGVLPEVGINAANIAYVVVTLMAICGLAAGIIYVKKIK